MPDAELFDVAPVAVALRPEDAPGHPTRRVDGVRCGERVNDDREVLRDGAAACRACAGGARRHRRMRFTARAVGATLFALAFGHVEAAVVAYVRLALVGTLDAAALAEVSDLVARPFPWGIELGREAATIVMLAGVALAAGRTLGERAALFLWTFALWDAQYYLSLRLLTGWPSRLDTIDVYFLIPVPWVGPVWLPLVIDAALVMVLARRIWR